jgi:quinol monooxygenase YgiN
MDIFRDAAGEDLYSSGNGTSSDGYVSPRIRVIRRTASPLMCMSAQDRLITTTSQPFPLSSHIVLFPTSYQTATMSFYTSPSISLHVKVFIAPDNVPTFKEAMKPVFDAVTAEPECLFFEIYHNPEKPGEFKWVENWAQDAEWLMSVSTKRT